MLMLKIIVWHCVKNNCEKSKRIVLLIVFSFSIIVLKMFKEFIFVVHDSCIFLCLFGMYISKFVVKYVANDYRHAVSKLFCEYNSLYLG